MPHTFDPNCVCQFCSLERERLTDRKYKMAGVDPISLELREAQIVLDTLRALYKERRTMRSVLAQTEKQMEHYVKQLSLMLAKPLTEILQIAEWDMKIVLEQKDLREDAPKVNNNEGESL